MRGLSPNGANCFLWLRTFSLASYGKLSLTDHDTVRTRDAALKVIVTQDASLENLVKIGTSVARDLTKAYATNPNLVYKGSRCSV